MENYEPDKNEWYDKTKNHWENTESSIKGVLGGNDQVHDSDVKTSNELLEGLIKNNIITPIKVLDCGAGIGRVTTNVLQNHFQEIDIMEQDDKYISYCQENFKNNPKIKNIYKSSLQDFTFPTKYNVIWIQWCVENLNDDDLINFLTKCSNNLQENGIIIVKENIISKGTKFWEEDFSKIRSDIVFKQIFQKSGLKIKQHFHHPNWPKDLLKVSIFLLTKLI
jgi:protein N-terminal methyltransferase